MQAQPTEPADGGVCVAHGYGLKLYVHRGHLIVHDGIGRSRRTRRYHRATSRLKRVVVIGHTGYVTLEALRWIQDARAAFVQIDSDGNLIATSSPARHHESKLRRAQVLAPENGLGNIALVALLRSKLEGQAHLAARLNHLRPSMLVNKTRSVSPADRIREHASQLHPELTIKDLRRVEAAAGRVYWQTWAHLPIQFDSGYKDRIPDHWQIAGPRTSQAENKARARKATSPVHAILNYSYAILETEATIACHALGLDPSLGLMHTDLRYRGSLAVDVMEPARPVVDSLVLDLLQFRVLRRGDVIETREGVCRIGAHLARELAGRSEMFLRAIAPHVEELARTLSRSATHPTPLTRRRHQASIAHTVSVDA